MVLFLHITSKVEGDPHQSLLTDKGGRGFPYLVYMDQEGEVLAQPKERSVKGFDATLGAVETYRTLKARVEKGDESVAGEYFLARLSLGQLKLAEAKAEAKEVKLTEEQAQKLDKLLLNLEVDEATATVRSREKLLEVGGMFRKMWQEGRVPTGNSALPFWYFIIEVAITEEQVELATKALAEFEQRFGEGKRWKRNIKTWKKKIEAIGK